MSYDHVIILKVVPCALLSQSQTHGRPPRPLPAHLAKAGRAPAHPVCLSRVSVSRSVEPDSLWPHGLQPTRLLCPWDFPGKDTGVGCHFLLLSRRERLTWDSPPLRPSPFSFFLSLTPKLNWLGSPVDSSPQVAGKPAPLLWQLQGGPKREAWRPPIPVRLTPAAKPPLFSLLQVASTTGCSPGKSLGRLAPLLRQGFLSFMHLSLNKCKVILSAKWCRSLNSHTVLLFFPRGRGDPDCQQQHECAQSCPTLHDPLDYSLPGSSVRGVSQAGILVWVAISYSRGSSPPTAADLVYLTTKVDHFWTFLYPLLYNKIIFIKNHGVKPIIRMARKKKQTTTMKFVLYFSRQSIYIWLHFLFLINLL